MSIDYCLVCDECGINIDGSKTSAAMVRRVARREGTMRRWRGMELCTKCFFRLSGNAECRETFAENVKYGGMP